MSYYPRHQDLTTHTKMYHAQDLDRYAYDLYDQNG